MSSEDADATTVTHVGAPVFRVFDNHSPLGDQGPEQRYQYPTTLAQPWIGFRAPASGRWAILEAPELSVREPRVRLELVPASSGTRRDDGNWPRPEELHGQPVGLEACFVDVDGHPQGSTYRALPVLARFADGPPPTQMSEGGTNSGSQ